jgi:hypothetical protein
LWLAFAWGLAESTCFFIVPDVLSSRLVLRNARTGFAACFCSLGGALLGGLTLYLTGKNPAITDTLLRAFVHIPGITRELVGQAQADLQQRGAAALFAGFVGGIPYKLYAVQAAAAGLGLTLFLTASAAARLARFMMVTLLAWGVGSGLLRRFSLKARLGVHAAAWLLFYSFYFWWMGI